ncbi:MAG: DUF4402 domain-containing protein [Alphaproteobacteria bacterium]|nr:DUF4402 domain-containing protein [Alphaproteobacteria bacterium]
MRKYFLLGTVALMMATNANATAVGASFSATADIVEATSISCDQDLNFGTIVFNPHLDSPEGDGYAEITPDGTPNVSGNVIAMSGATPAYCTIPGEEFNDIQIIIANQNEVKLTDTTTPSKTIEAQISYEWDEPIIYFGGTIDSGLTSIQAGTYTGTVDFAVIY